MRQRSARQPRASRCSVTALALALPPSETTRSPGSAQCALFPAILLVLVGVYLVLPLGIMSLAAACLIAALWGFLNHFGLNILVLMLSRANSDAKTTILGLNSGVTYLGALLGSGLAGPVYDSFGFTPVALGAAGGLALAAGLATTLPKIMPQV